MERSRMIADPSCFIKTRLSFFQLLLLLSYIHLESSLPACIGDTRQLQDILRRQEDEWIPRIGQETYFDMKQRAWTDMNWQTRRAWDATRKHFLQQKLIDHTMSSRGLREYLSNLLRGIEQVSAQSLNAISARSTLSSSKPRMSLSEKANLAMVCFSVGVTATPGNGTPLESLLVDPNQYLIKELGSELCVSPLFKGGVSLSQLWNSCASLDMLFCPGECRAIGHHAISAREPVYDMKATMIIRSQETWTCQYSRSEFCDTVDTEPIQRPKRAWEPYFGNIEGVDSTKRRKVSSPKKARKQADTLLRL